MSVNNSAIGESWEDVREEFMSFLTPKERADIDANVKALGRLIDARDAGRITRLHFNVASDRLARFRPVGARRSVSRRRYLPKAAL